MKAEIERLLPVFLLKDATGYALAKATEKAFEIAAASAEKALGEIQDVEKMSEKRLDEMAWEYNIPYDYTAALETKRSWIRNAWTLSRIYGTKKGLETFLNAYFPNAAVEENWEYGGSAYHFRISFPDGWTPGKEGWLSEAVSALKNVRSALDALQFMSQWERKLYAGLAIYEIQNQDLGVTPQPDLDNEAFVGDELSDILTDEFGVAMTE